MGYFKAPRPPKKAAKPTERRPRDWRRQTHVCISDGTRDWDDVSICADCGFRRDHKIHDLNESVQVEATALEQRKLGEAPE
jgi:hypothetical protein